MKPGVCYAEIDNKTSPISYIYFKASQNLKIIQSILNTHIFKYNEVYIKTLSERVTKVQLKNSGFPKRTMVRQLAEMKSKSYSP